MRRHGLTLATLSALSIFAALPASAPAQGTSAAAPAAAGARTLNIDRNHSTVGFRIRHIVSRVDGRFNDFAGTITYDPAAPERSAVDVTVQAASIDTDAADRDKHLRSPDFFDVERFPTLTFKSVSVQKKSPTELELAGDLTIHGVTKRVTVPVELLGMVPYRGGEKAGFATTFTLDRKDFGISWNRALDQGGALLGDEVQVTIQLESGWAPPKPPEAPKPSGR